MINEHRLLQLDLHFVLWTREPQERNHEFSIMYEARCCEYSQCKACDDSSDRACAKLFDKIIEARRAPRLDNEAFEMYLNGVKTETHDFSLATLDTYLRVVEARIYFPPR